MKSIIDIVCPILDIIMIYSMIKSIRNIIATKKRIKKTKVDIDRLSKENKVLENILKHPEEFYNAMDDLNTTLNLNKINGIE